MSVPDVSPEAPPLLWRATLAGLGRLPQGALSRAFGRFTDVPVPRPMRRAVLGAFVRAVGIDMGEAELPLEEYGSIGDLFVRRLRPGVRAWPDDPRVAGSPVDGVIGQSGRIANGTLLQAKGRTYSAAQLLDDEAETARFDGGAFVTLYLSPRHYHRIHSPAGGAVVKSRHIPGALLPVNDAAVRHVASLFARNERLVCWQDGPIGRVAIVAVGAYNVGRISAAFDDAWSWEYRRWATNRSRARADTRVYDPAPIIARGDELMAFHLGSTVVLLFEPRVRLAQLRPGAEIRLGEAVAEG